MKCSRCEKDIKARILHNYVCVLCPECFDELTKKVKDGER